MAYSPKKSYKVFQMASTCEDNYYLSWNSGNFNPWSRLCSSICGVQTLSLCYQCWYFTNHLWGVCDGNVNRQLRERDVSVFWITKGATSTYIIWTAILLHSVIRWPWLGNFTSHDSTNCPKSAMFLPGYTGSHQSYCKAIVYIGCTTGLAQVPLLHIYCTVCMISIVVSIQKGVHFYRCMELVSISNFQYYSAGSGMMALIKSILHGENNKNTGTSNK